MKQTARIIMGVFVFGIATQAMATKNDYSRYGPSYHSMNTAKAFSNSSSLARARAFSEGGNSDANQSLSIRNRRQAAGFGMGTIVNTADCQQGQGAAVTLPLGGGGLQFTRTLDPCERRMWILTFAHLESIGMNTGTVTKDIYCASPIPAETDECLDHKIYRAKNAVLRQAKLRELRDLERTAANLASDNDSTHEIESTDLVKIEDTVFNPFNW